MRSTMAVTLLALALALTGCGSDTKDGSDDGGDVPDPCSFLTIEDASAIVGISYGKAAGPDEDDAFPINACTYEQQPTAMPFRLMVEGGTKTTLADMVEAAYASGRTKPEQEPVQVPGADEAALLTWNSPSFAARAVFAMADGRGYGVMFNGAIETAVHLMARVLGEPVVAAAGAPLDKPCQAPDAAAASRILGQKVTATATANFPAATVCDFGPADLPVASVVSSRGAGSDLDQYWAENVIVLDQKAKPRDIEIPGADAARLIHEAGDTGSTTAVAFKGEQIFQVTVSFVKADREQAATELLRYAVGSGGTGAQ